MLQNLSKEIPECYPRNFVPKNPRINGSVASSRLFHVDGGYGDRASAEADMRTIGACAGTER